MGEEKAALSERDGNEKKRKETTTVSIDLENSAQSNPSEKEHGEVSASQASMSLNDSPDAAALQSGYRRFLPSVLLQTTRMPRQWLLDRCSGRDKYDPLHRPPCPLCYVPVFVKWWPDILEQNLCCESCGRCGCIRGDTDTTRKRRVIMWIALVSNISGLLLMFLSAQAMADKSFDLLWRSSFTRISLTVTRGPVDFNEVAFYKVGLRAIAFRSYQFDRQGVVPFSEFCDLNQTEHPILSAWIGSTVQDECDRCEKISRRIVPSLFLSMLSYIPNFLTDVLRMWSNYDVNCQKTLATTFSWVSLATALYTWINYRAKCWSSFKTDPFALNEDLEPVNIDSSDVYVVGAFDWEAGFAQVCLAGATLLKVVDIVCNFVLQTPTITRDFVEQAEYERRYGTEVEPMQSNEEDQPFLVQDDDERSSG